MINNSTNLLKQALEAFETDDWAKKLNASIAIRKALADDSVEIDAKQTQSDLEKDANRYRKLRKSAVFGYPSSEGSGDKDAYLVITGYGYRERKSLTDAAVDASMGITEN